MTTRPADDQAADPTLPSEDGRRPRLKREVWIVIGLSLGQSGVYALLNIIDRLTRPEKLGDQSATLNPTQNNRSWLDLLYQLVGIGFALVPVALALYLLAGPGVSAFRRIGFDLRGRRTALTDLGWGAVLAAVIGIPGLGVYFAGRALGVTVDVVASGLNQYWWTVPVLLLSAAQNAVLEEVIVVGYLLTRLKELGFRPWVAIGLSALLRGSYHLYQGFGSFVGNALMGVVFGYWFRRTGRVMPLVVAHTLLDVVAFVGYALLKNVLNL